MKNILLLVHDDAGQEARFQAALDVTRAVAGHLTCLDVTIIPALVGTDYVGDMGFAMMLDDERQRESANRSTLERRLACQDVPWDWMDATGDIAGCLKSASELADLIVVNRQLDAFPLPDMRTAAAEVIVRSGKPVLAVPDSLKRLALDRPMIAWDGSPAAAAALRASVPLLQCASRVVILEIGNSSVVAPGEDAALYLSRNGVSAIVDRVADNDASAAQVLLDKAASGAFDYVVMGGFGHKRFVEALFGGATRAMLTKCPIPLFMTH